MISAQAIAETGLLTHDEVMAVLSNALCNTFTREKVRVLIADHTRSLPLPGLFRMLVAPIPLSATRRYALWRTQAAQRWDRGTRANGLFVR